MESAAATTPDETRISYRTCPFCEATCGLEVTTRGDEVLSVKGDADDVFSKGFICPKSIGLKELHSDPDRLRTPLVRGADGELRESTWEEAFAEIDRRLGPILAEHGRDAVGVYLGNPSAHNLAAIYLPVMIKAIGTKNVFSASSVDQMPKHLSSMLMFGHALSIPVPDVDRTDHLMILGANPLASNGSLMTAPDMRGRLRRLRERGGKVVVIDPRLSRTASVADEHHFIRPGRDAHLLLGIANTLFAEDLVDLGRLGDHVAGLEEIESLAAEYPPELVAEACGISAEEIRRMAHELAAAERSAVYARIGTTTQSFGTLVSWLVDVLNVLTGNLDREGGAMFPLAAAGQRNSSGTPGIGPGGRVGRWQSRVRGLDEVIGELPVSCLAEEIETEGEGQVRALITVAGNPTVSTPNAGRLERAIEGLELMVSVDIYVNETSRHADVILPAPSPAEKSHFDFALYQLAIRSVANYSEPVLEPDPGALPEWQTLLRLAAIAAGQGPEADIEALDELTVRAVIAREIGTPGSRIEGRDAEEILAKLEPRTGPERMLDLQLRVGPYGDAFGAPDAPGDLTLAKLEANPHGLDFGEHSPRIPDVLRTPSGKIELAPERIVADVARLREGFAEAANGGMVLIGRRQLRSNNSWMHNLPALVKGPDRCTMHLHPADAERLGIGEGERATVRSRTGELVAPVEITEAIMPGVVSIPHGWGHDVDGVRLGVASAHAGVNSNLLADEGLIDVPSGNAVLNGIPVEVVPVRAPAETVAVAG